MRRVGGVRLGGGLRGRRRPWRAVDMAVLDLETTGLDPAHDAIVSFGVVPVNAGEVRLDRAVYEVVDPGRPVPPAVVAIHGIRPVDVVAAVPRERAVEHLRRSLDGRVVVAWTSWVEAGFLAATLGGTATAWERHIVDVRRLAMLVDHLRGTHPSPAVSEPLPATAERFGVPPDREHHALWDAFVTAELFIVLATHLERAGRGHLAAIHAAGVGRLRLDPRRPTLAPA